MTADQVKDLLNAVKNPNLQAVLQKPDADPVAIAAAAGYIVSREQLELRMTELSDAKPEDAAGGCLKGSMV
jgi:hypothetical protein